MKTFACLAAFLILCTSCNQKKPNSQEQEQSLDRNVISAVDPARYGIDSELFANLTAKIERQDYPNIHSLLIAKNGKLIYEQYFSGKDQNFGRDIGIINNTDTTLHDIRSITKSIVSGCIGIAIEKGYVKNVDQKISEFFPELDTIFKDDKTNWTIQDFLTMTSGLSWNEHVPYNDPANDEVQMTYSADPVTYVLNKPLETMPGSKFNYNGGATQILAEILIRSSKTPLDQFIKRHLFEPLHIEKFEWTKYSVWNGADKFAAAGGLRLTSRDLMKIGLLYRNKGKWNGRQILSEKWVKESFIERIEFPSEVAEGNDAYGYQFWMWPDIAGDKTFKMIAAIGNGDQKIYWDLENDLLVVTTAGNYNQWDIKNDSYAMLKNEIYPIILTSKN